MSVVQLTSFFVEPPKKNNTDPVIIIEKFRTVCTTVNKIIGHPIPYDEYLKNGKNNPDGDNTYANPQNKTIGARQQMAGQSTSSSY